MKKKEQRHCVQCLKNLRFDIEVGAFICDNEECPNYSLYQEGLVSLSDKNKKNIQSN
jgi:hypothetical protein